MTAEQCTSDNWQFQSSIPLYTGLHASPKFCASTLFTSTFNNVIDCLFVHFYFLIGSSSERFCAVAHNASGSIALLNGATCKNGFFKCFSRNFVFVYFYLSIFATCKNGFFDWFLPLYIFIVQIQLHSQPKTKSCK